MRHICWAFLLCCGLATAQQYPSKPVKLVVAYPPGGSSDLMARVFAAKLTDMWGQQVLVENKPGAAGAIGTEYAARQPADGYSFMIANLGPIAVNPLLSNVPYNVEKDFAPVSQISQGPNVLVVRTDAPFRSLKDIIDYGKANPGKLTYGTSGPGSVSHLSGEMLKNITQIQATEVPYKGGVDAIKDLLGGQFNFIFSDTLPAMAHVRAGKLRALCMTGSDKFELLADQPSCQAAAPGLVAVNWWGVVMPAGTPRPMISKLHADTVKLLSDPDVKQKFAELGVVATSSTPEQFGAFIKAETEKYAKLIKEANIKVNQ
ncbi:MAG: tripartite tricarboxylate transporter substrate binding protein [Betaproteobacteria bacterium]|nr:tripartite tricarboxylate transporter substrate binding protein [Betaproteobacteria bacterium]